MKLIPFLMPGFPSIRASHDVLLFLQTQRDVIIETALPTLQPSGSALVQKVRKIVIRAGIKAEDVISTFRANRKQTAMLMLHTEPDGQQLSQIHASFDYAIAPFDAEKVAQLNASAATKRKNQNLATRFGAQVAPDDTDMEAKVRASDGFVYLKTAAEREGDLFSENQIRGAIGKIKSIKAVEVFCGFGVKTPADVRMLKSAGADGVFLGSEALKAQEESLAQFKAFWQPIQEEAENGKQRDKNA